MTIRRRQALQSMGATVANRSKAPDALAIPSPEFEAIKERGQRVMVTLDGGAMHYVTAYNQAEGWIDHIPRGYDGNPARSPDGESYIIRRLTGEVRAFICT